MKAFAQESLLRRAELNTPTCATNGKRSDEWLDSIGGVCICAKALTVPASTCMVEFSPKTIRKKGTYLDTKAISHNKPWTRFPNGTKVRLLEGGQEGLIDGMTELVVGPGRNPDGRTQYRLNVGDQSRILAGQDDLAVLTDHEGLVLIVKQSIEYRRLVTDQLRAELASDRFVASA